MQPKLSHFGVFRAPSHLGLVSKAGPFACICRYADTPTRRYLILYGCGFAINIAGYRPGVAAGEAAGVGLPGVITTPTP